MEYKKEEEVVKSLVQQLVIGEKDEMCFILCFWLCVHKLCNATLIKVQVVECWLIFLNRGNPSKRAGSICNNFTIKK